MDGKMIKGALDSLNLDNVDLLVIENVGNLVCPAAFELGEDIKITVLSTTEGNDKPLKYPRMFENSEAIILNKMDLVEHTNFNKAEFYQDVNSLNAHAKIFETSCIKDWGIDELCSWLSQQIDNKRGGNVLCQE